MGRGGAWGGWGELEPQSRDLRSTEPWKWPGGLVRASRGMRRRMRSSGDPVRPLREPQGGAGSQHRRVDMSQTLPPSCPSAPHAPGQAQRRDSPAGFVSQDAVSFLDEPSSSGDAPGYGGGTAVSPQHSQGATSQSQARQWQKQSWQGLRGPSQCRDRPSTGPPSARGRRLPARSGSFSPHQLEMMIPVTLSANKH